MRKNQKKNVEIPIVDDKKAIVKSEKTNQSNKNDKQPSSNSFCH